MLCCFRVFKVKASRDFCFAFNFEMRFYLRLRFFVIKTAEAPKIETLKIAGILAIESLQPVFSVPFLASVKGKLFVSVA